MQIFHEKVTHTHKKQQPSFFFFDFRVKCYLNMFSWDSLYKIRTGLLYQNGGKKEGNVYKTCRNIHTAHSHIPKTKHKDAHTEDNKQKTINARKILEIVSGKETGIEILHCKLNLMIVHDASQLHWPFTPFSSIPLTSV